MSEESSHHHHRHRHHGDGDSQRDYGDLFRRLRSLFLFGATIGILALAVYSIRSAKSGARSEEERALERAEALSQKVSAAMQKSGVSEADLDTLSKNTNDAAGRVLANVVREPIPAKTSDVVFLWNDLASTAPAIRFSHSRARDAGRILERAGLSSTRWPSSALDEALAAPCRVAHFVAVENLPEGADEILGAFLERGGRIVVHGPAAAALLSRFGIAPETKIEMVRPANGTDWTSFQFGKTRPALAPLWVETTASMVFDVSAAIEGTPTAVLATWRSASSQEDGPPAVLRSLNGYWLVRPLYSDGAVEPRERLLLSLTCSLAPELWSRAAENFERAIGAEAMTPSVMAAAVAAASDEGVAAPSSEVTTPRAACAALRLAAGKAPPEALLKSLERVRNLADTLSNLRDGNHFETVLTTLFQMRRELRLAYGAIHPLGKVRAGRPLWVWMQNPWADEVGGWDTAADALEAIGTTDVILSVGSIGSCLVDIPGSRRSRYRENRFDPIPQAVIACRRRGIRVHACLAAFSQEGAPAALVKEWSRAGRLIEGASTTWLDPTMEENVTALADAAVWLLEKEGVDGVCFDYFRYPDEKLAGMKSSAALASCLARIRNKMGQSRAVANDAKPPLSVCVYGGYPACIAKVGQDWGEWIRNGLVDTVLPMNYSAKEEDLSKLLAKQKEFLPSTVCGIGATAYEALLSPPQVLDQLRLAYAQPVGGAFVYRFDRRFLEEILPILEAAK